MPARGGSYETANELSGEGGWSADTEDQAMENLYGHDFSNLTEPDDGDGERRPFRFEEPRAQEEGSSGRPPQKQRSDPEHGPPARASRAQDARPRPAPPTSTAKGTTKEDSVPIDDTEADTTWKRAKKVRPTGLKGLVMLFIIFLFIVSTFFTNGVLTWFGGAVRCRTPTSYGVVLQGIFLVLFFVIAVHMIETGIL